MFRGNTLPLTLVTVCGVLTVIATFQPELEQKAIEKQGEVALPRKTAAERTVDDTAISRAIKEDLRAAAQELRAGKGFAWGIRQAIFGKPEDKSQPGDVK